ncbi:TPA: hypothetical protein L9A90_005860, partial [Klebsiella pneumoniae]|nr:hypothetical protein [Klebsiella pneumoniae]
MSEEKRPVLSLKRK